MKCVRIVEMWERGGIGIFFEWDTPEGRYVEGRSRNNGLTKILLPNREHGATTDPDFEPWALFTDDEARAVLTALNRHYDGGEDTRSLRRDYDAERARVDKMLETVLRPPIILNGSVA